MPEDELTALLILNRINGLGPTGAKFLYGQFGSALEIFRSRDHLKEIIPGVDSRLIEALDGFGYDSFIREELEFIERHGIRCVTPVDPEYPARMLDLSDSPLVLFSLGNVNFNASRTVAEPVQFSKAYSEMLVTLAGISIPVRPSHKANAPLAIFVTPEGIVNTP